MPRRRATPTACWPSRPLWLKRLESTFFATGTNSVTAPVVSLSPACPHPNPPMRSGKGMPCGFRGKFKDGSIGRRDVYWRSCRKNRHDRFLTLLSCIRKKKKGLPYLIRQVHWTGTRVKCIITRLRYTSNDMKMFPRTIACRSKTTCNPIFNNML